jgi:gephyrin
LRAAEIGLLATVGRVKAVKVFSKPVIGLISTGNELVEASCETLDDGKIRDSNKLMLTSILRELGVTKEIKDYGAVGDNHEELDQVMQRATRECDIVVTSGGVSMGEMDLVKPYIEKNGEVFFGRINMKPGKPTTFGLLNKALVFALPGNPVSAFVTAYLFVVPSAKLLSG